MSEVIIRKGNRADIPQVFELVKELALFEKAPEQVTNTVDQMTEDGFGANPIFGLIVAEREMSIVGISIFYYRYSTWKGKRLYLEDIVVTEKERGNGIGGLLMDDTISHAKISGCSGMMWQALDWNQKALDFYKKYKASFDDEWVNCHLDFR
ncbi:MAG: GNAT family N-acetyltransferase [Reichenbachiella sp.]